MCGLPTGVLNGYARHMAISERQVLDALSRTPFVDSTELVLLLGEPHTTVTRLGESRTFTLTLFLDL